MNRPLRKMNKKESLLVRGLLLESYFTPDWPESAGWEGGLRASLKDYPEKHIGLPPDKILRNLKEEINFAERYGFLCLTGFDSAWFDELKHLVDAYLLKEFGTLSPKLVHI